MGEAPLGTGPSGKRSVLVVWSVWVRCAMCRAGWTESPVLQRQLAYTRERFFARGLGIRRFIRAIITTNRGPATARLQLRRIVARHEAGSVLFPRCRNALQGHAAGVAIGSPVLSKVLSTATTGKPPPFSEVSTIRPAITGARPPPALGAHDLRQRPDRRRFPGPARFDPATLARTASDRRLPSHLRRPAETDCRSPPPRPTGARRGRGEGNRSRARRPLRPRADPTRGRHLHKRTARTASPSFPPHASPRSSAPPG